MLMNNIENQYVAPDLQIVEFCTDQCILIGSGIASGDAGGEDGWDE